MTKTTTLNSAIVCDGVKRTTDAVDLNSLFGERYKVTYEVAFAAEYGRRSQFEDPWLLILECHHGHVFPWGGSRLAVSTNHHGVIASKLIALDCCKLVQDGTDGVTLTFDVADFRRVAAIIKPRGRRRLTAPQRRALVAAGRASRFARANAESAVESEVNGVVPELRTIHVPLATAIM